jgi:hypothetical protein
VADEQRAVTLQEALARLERIELLLGLQRLKQASRSGAELEANIKLSHYYSCLSNHCGGGPRIKIRQPHQHSLCARVVR